MVKLLTMACIAGAALSASATASANRYATIVNIGFPAGDADRGVAATIRTDTMNNVNCSNFVDHEMWYGVDTNFWVEVGFTSGAKQGGGCATHASFWADNRNGGGYHEHYITENITLSKSYQLWVGGGAANCSWTVNMGNLQIGISSNNCPGPIRHASAGIENNDDFAW